MNALLRRLSLCFACSLALVGAIRMNATESVVVRDGSLPTMDAPAIKIGDLAKDVLAKNELMKNELMKNELMKNELMKNELMKNELNKVDSLQKMGTDPILEKMGSDPILSAELQF